jgi:hypothetical protein
MTRWLRIVVCGAVASLGGCGNVSEHLSMEEWREVGQALPPTPDQEGAFVVTTTVAGEGPSVGAGIWSKPV